MLSKLLNEHSAITRLSLMNVAMSIGSNELFNEEFLSALAESKLQSLSFSVRANPWMRAVFSLSCTV